jgi:hypothetical protein
MDHDDRQIHGNDGKFPWENRFQILFLWEFGGRISLITSKDQQTSFGCMEK